MDLTQVSADDRHVVDVPNGAVARRGETLIQLLDWLDAANYDFIAPTPSTHSRVLARPDRQEGRNVADLLGWSVPCRAESLPRDLIDILDDAGVLEHAGGGLVRSRVRVSRVFGNLFVHSAFPTVAQDAVFLGP